MVGKKRDFALHQLILLSDVFIFETLSGAYFLVTFSVVPVSGFLINFSLSFVHDALYCGVFTFFLFNEFTCSVLSYTMYFVIHLMAIACYILQNLD